MDGIDDYNIISNGSSSKVMGGEGSDQAWLGVQMNQFGEGGGDKTVTVAAQKAAKDKREASSTWGALVT
jgi:hypothetical protein